MESMALNGHPSHDHFYGVSLPSHADINHNENKAFVFTDMNEALNEAKKFKGSRFKAFNTIEEAIAFSGQTVDIDDKPSTDIEKMLCPYSSPHARDLTKLRRAIEKGNMEEITQLIWSNPRYLVSSADTPVILMEGPRYNGCHIAAKESKAAIIRLVLDTVSSVEFMKLVYPYDKSDVTISRINYLLDSYLNTPDKGFNETPLHFACKFGCEEAVSVLLSYSDCDINKLNKNGEKASDIVCNRKGDNVTKTQIIHLFDSRLYIPLFRDENLTAKVGQPFEGALEDDNVIGLAGPMSPIQAKQIYSVLKSPLKCSPQEKTIRLTDPHKGMERIARKLCEQMNINWVVYSDNSDKT